MADLPNHPIHRAALLFMAAVEIARREHSGAFRAISPLFQIALEDQAGQLFNIETAARKLQPILGDSFTPQALEAFAPQLVEAGWLTEHRTRNNAASYVVSADIRSVDTPETEGNILAQLDKLYGSFVDFREELAPLLKLSLDKAQFKWQIFCWATSLDGLDRDKIRAAASSMLDGTPLRLRLNLNDEAANFGKVDRQLSVEFAGFAKWLQKNGREEFSIISSLTELGLAVEFLEEIRNPSNILTTNLETVFVLDAPVLLDLFGLSGPARQEGLKACVTSLKAAGAKFTTLPHCLEEMSEILKTVLALPKPQRFGLSGDAFKFDPNLEMLARAVAGNPATAAARYGVQVSTLHLSRQQNSRYFPEEEVDRFRKSSNWHDPTKVTQKLRDAESIAYVVRQRLGHIPSDLFDTKYILVTRNSTFTGYAKAFMRSRFDYPKFALGPAIEIKTMAAITWMRLGATANSNLPNLQLISACDRILQSNALLLRKAERKVKELRDQEAANVLLMSHQAVLDLVISTGGDPDVLDGARAQDVLDALTRSAEARARKEEREKARVIQAKNMHEISSRDSEIQRVSLEKLKAEADLNRIASDLDVHLKEKELRIQNLYNLYRLQSEKIAHSYIIFLWSVSAIYGFFGQFFIWNGIDWWLSNWVNVFWGLSVQVSGLLAVIFGIRMFAIGQRDAPAVLHAWLTNRILRRRINKIPLEEDRNSVIAIAAQSS